MHSAVLQSKDYIKFSDRYTVEVMSMGSLEEGIKKNDRKAATYEAKDGNEYLVEFPNLTVDEMLAIPRTKAGTYNDTGKIPFTALIDPHTEEEIHRWSGGISASTIMDEVKEKSKELRKEHGDGIDRRTIRSLDDAIADAREEIADGDFAKALSAIEKASSKSDDWPQILLDRVAKAKAEVVAAASAKLDEIEKQGEDDPRTALRELGRLRSKVRGLELDDRVSELMERLKAS